MLSCDHKLAKLKTMRVRAVLLLGWIAMVWVPASWAEVIDPHTIKNWGLPHIHALEAAKIEDGKPEIVVAVVDTGIDPKEPTLLPHLWKNLQDHKPHEYGYDFVLNTSNPIDRHGHGTHIAGIIGATTNTRTGTSGVAHRVSIMALRYYSDQVSESNNLKNSIRAMHYAIDHGARIINYSGGGASFSEEEYQVVKKAERKGVLLVAAAGNESSNTDIPKFTFYPAGYSLKNIISVASTNIDNQILESSNWGSGTVHVAAPGEGILSTLPNLRVGKLTGTSQATAFVSGIAALLLSHNPKLNFAQLKKLIETYVDRFTQLKTKVSSGGRVNAYRSLLAVPVK